MLPGFDPFRIVTVELAVRNGSFTEPPELHGLSHLYEHMFFKPNFAMMLSRMRERTAGPIFRVRRGMCSA